MLILTYELVLIHPKVEPLPGVQAYKYDLLFYSRQTLHSNKPKLCKTLSTLPQYPYCTIFDIFQVD